METIRKALQTAGVDRVTADSRQAGPGVAFFAARPVTPGAADGHAFLDAALARGTKLCVGEWPKPTGFVGEYIQVSDSRMALAFAAAELAGHPTRSMRLFGVTGTSGKTTTTFLLESILRAAGENVGLIGTVAVRWNGRSRDSTHTTPGAPDLQLLLSEMRADGVTAVVMEVSSHALKQRRADFVAFDSVGFSNLSPEHLDYHPTLEDYFASKARLFGELLDESRAAGKHPIAAVNPETDWGRVLVDRIRKEGKTPVFEAPAAGLSPFQDLSGTRGIYQGSGFKSPLIGEFNSANIALALEMAFRAGVDLGACVRGVESLTGVPGRVEQVPNQRGIAVCVDYAHKPDALEKVLRTVRTSVKGRLICVFGCGGDRDRTKRPVMGRIAVELADSVVITSDNPRTESPDLIIREILAGIEGGGSHPRVYVDADRARAIERAVRDARPGDFVLIAGKGHETYQILGTQKVHFDDREIAARVLSE